MESDTPRPTTKLEALDYRQREGSQSHDCRRLQGNASITLGIRCIKPSGSPKVTKQNKTTMKDNSNLYKTPFQIGLSERNAEWRRFFAQAMRAGANKGKVYEAIAKRYGFSEGHVRRVISNS